MANAPGAFRRCWTKPEETMVSKDLSWEVEQGLCCRRYFKHAAACGKNSAVHSFRCFRCVAHCGAHKLLSVLCKTPSRPLSGLEKCMEVYDFMVLLARFIAYMSTENAHQRTCFLWKSPALPRGKSKALPAVPEDSDDEVLLMAAQTFDAKPKAQATDVQTAARVHPLVEDSDDDLLMHASNLYDRREAPEVGIPLPNFLPVKRKGHCLSCSTKHAHIVFLLLCESGLF